MLTVQISLTFAYRRLPICDKIRKLKDRGAKNAIFKEALGHLNISTETEYEAYRLAQLKISAQEVPNTKSSKSRVTVRV